jgi:uncharacterized membrane protein
MKPKTPIVLMSCLVVGAVLSASSPLSGWAASFDESFTWKMVHDFPATDVVRRTASDVHPPLYYLLLKAWTWLAGDSLSSLRSFSLAAAALSLPAAYFLLREFSATCGLPRESATRFTVIAMLLCATSAALVKAAISARMYSLGTLLFTLSSGCMLRALRSQRSSGWWVLYGITCTAFLYTHNYALLFLAGQMLFAGGYLCCRPAAGGSAGWYQALAACTLPVAAFIPWIGVILRQTSQVDDSYWIPPLDVGQVLLVPYRLVFPQSSGAAPLSHSVGLVIAASVVGVLIVGFLCRRQRPVLAGLAALLGTPTALAAAASALWTPILVTRYLTFGVPVLFAAVAAAVTLAVRERVPLALVTGLLIFNNLAAIHTIVEEQVPLQACGAAQAARYLADHAEADEPIVVLDATLYLRMALYTDHRVQLSSSVGPIRHFEGRPVIGQHDLVGADALRSATTIWLVTWPVTITDSSRRLGPLLTDWTSAAPPEVFHDGIVSHNVAVTRFVRRTAAARPPAPARGEFHRVLRFVECAGAAVAETSEGGRS